MRFVDYLNLITEAKQVGEIYHFTNTRALSNMFSDSFRMTSFNKKTISFTRNPSAYLFGDIKRTNPNVIIVVDGDKLSSKYRIRAVRGADNDEDNPLDFGNKNVSRVPFEWGESEEAVVIPKSGYVDISKYIKKIGMTPHRDERIRQGQQFILDEIQKKYPHIKTVLNRHGMKPNFE